MKLKYYMRGLGIGIILTTLIFIISGNKEKLTDKQIIARASDLGMVMQDKQTADDVLDENAAVSPTPSSAVSPTASPQPTATQEPTPTQKPSGTPEPTDTPMPSITPDPADTPVPTVTMKPAATPKPTEAPTKAPTQDTGTGSQQTGDNETGDEQDNQPVSERMDIVFSIVSGMSSGKVSKLLQEVGLIDDADKFNNFIVKAGKADVIRVGTFTISKGATYEEILNAITK